MSQERRKAKRFKDFARVDIHEMCVFPGILKDISVNGCRVRFSANLDIDMDSEYEIKIYQSCKKNVQPFNLIGIPVWVQKYPDATEIGVQILRSPDTKQLQEYIHVFHETATLDEDS